MKLTKRQIKKLKKLADDRLKWLRACIKGEKWAVEEYQDCRFCDEPIGCGDVCPAFGCCAYYISNSRDLLKTAFKFDDLTGARKSRAKAHYKNLKPLIDRWRRKYIWEK